MGGMSATIALIAWVPIALWLYQTRSISQATLWTILGGYLLLPVGTGIKIIEGIPQLDKTSVPCLAALLGCLLKTRLRLWRAFGIPEILLLVLLIGPFVTSVLNNDAVISGSLILPPLGPYDGLSAAVAEFLFLIPFFLGRQLFATSANVEEILRTLIKAGVLYSLPMLLEIRLSPQLHAWVYGYQQFGFQTQMRYGGFRPVVFLENGLVTAFFSITAMVAAAAFWRARIRVWKQSSALITAYLGVLQILCKSLGTLVYGVLLVPLVRLAKPRWQLRVALILAAITVTYPLLRLSDLVPTQYMLSIAGSVSEDRADSLRVRFDNEQQLLDRASERFMFGWGRWGRGRIYDAYGFDRSITDGRWVITLGQYGIIGFLAEFGLLALSVFRAASALRFAETDRDRLLLSTLALIIAANMIDLLPNASISPWTWLLTGALLGRSEMLRKAQRASRRVSTAPNDASVEDQAVPADGASRNTFTY
jgi:hypothetical protein